MADSLWDQNVICSVAVLGLRASMLELLAVIQKKFTQGG